jgi:hypothetical protein
MFLQGEPQLAPSNSEEQTQSLPNTSEVEESASASTPPLISQEELLRAAKDSTQLPAINTTPSINNNALITPTKAPSGKRTTKPKGKGKNSDPSVFDAREMILTLAQLPDLGWDSLEFPMVDGGADSAKTHAIWKHQQKTIVGAGDREVSIVCPQYAHIQHSIISTSILCA